MHPYLTKYCCKEHAQAAVFFQKQLSYEPVFARMDIAFLPYGKSPYETQTATLEELEAIALNNQLSLHQAAQYFAMSSIKVTKEEAHMIGQGPTTSADVDLANLTDKLELVTIRERDPNDTSMDDLAGVDEELIGNPNVIEGYTAKK